MNIVRARAVAGQVVRVVYTAEPVHRSRASARDALNPANYVFSMVTGVATVALAVGVDPGIIVGPALAVGNGGLVGERAVDVHVDRALIAGLTYRVTVANVDALAGGAIGAPFFADFGGSVKLQTTRLPARRQDLTDLRSTPFDGRYVIDGTGDVDTEAGLQSYKKRVIRRIMTPKNSFATLPGYGVGVRLKEVASIAQVAALKADCVQQIKQEPETADVQATTSLTATGILTIQMSIRTKLGALLETGVRASPDGAVVVL